MTPQPEWVGQLNALVFALWKPCCVCHPILKALLAGFGLADQSSIICLRSKIRGLQTAPVCLDSLVFASEAIACYLWFKAGLTLKIISHQTFSFLYRKERMALLMYFRMVEESGKVLQLWQNVSPLECVYRCKPLLYPFLLKQSQKSGHKEQRKEFICFKKKAKSKQQECRPMM